MMDNRVNKNSEIETIKQLINTLPEVYQSIYLGEELIQEGVRRNDWERLDVIKQYIKPKQTILDIGSNVGFFTIQLAKLFPDNVFLSIESNYRYARLQQELLNYEQLENVVLINSQITVDWLKAASQACVYFDMTILLSVLHHIEEVDLFLEELSKVSKSFIIELPNQNESGVCGKHILRNKLTPDKLRSIKPIFEKLDYEATTHCDPHLKRPFYYADSPNYEREALFPYIGYPLAPRHYWIKSDENNRVTLYKTHLKQTIELTPGFLVNDIAKIGTILFPPQERLMQQVEKQFGFLDTLENVADIRPWNLLFTSRGLEFIDYRYSDDLDTTLQYDKERDFRIICSYLEKLYRRTSPVILIDGVFFQFYRTGIARVWISLLQEWAKTSFAQHIIVLDRVGTVPKVKGIKYRLIPPYDYGNTEADRAMLEQICEEEEADLFISTYYTTPLSTPSVFMAYDMIPEVLGANLAEPMWREKHYGIHHASAYMAISENTAQDLVKCFPSISAESVTVAHCGVSRDFVPATAEQINDFKSKYGILKPYFMLVGVGGGYKNSIVFFKALAQLYSRQGFDIVCTGSGGFLPDELRRYTSGITVHILQLNDRELQLAYSGAIALVYPSLYEGFGLPIVEAMACGCPVITSPNASIPEVAGEAALYVNENDVSGVANLLCEVQKPAVRQALIVSGLEQAQKFSWSNMANQVSSALIEATLLRYNLKGINLIIFPDWFEAEEVLGLELERVIRAIALHPEKDSITLLVDTSGICEEDATLILSSVAMNLLMQEELDVTTSPEISLLGNLGEMQWQVLLPRVNARIILERENQDAIAGVKASSIPSWKLESFGNKQIV